MASSMTALGLEQIRRRKGVSLSDIAESTKIGTHFLRAIESEDFGKLPGGLFNRSYIRQYAAAVGVPEDELMRAYSEFEAEQERKTGAASPPPARGSRLRWIASLLASVVSTSTP